MEAKKAKKIIRSLEGKVVSNKTDKTVIVAVDTFRTHRIYKKRFRITKRYKAHDEKNEYKEGDKITIRECRPLSRDKRWKVVGIVK
ncbi:MAG: 30S ribosomal protein S17 [Parcubacteria group bacterium]|nr:30S ribosomal protein S17 [Parcubacteria group bacterium]